MPASRPGIRPPLPQLQALKPAGCAEIPEEQALGGNRAPFRARVPERIGRGDALIVVRGDRPAWSLSHLLKGMERLVPVQGGVQLAREQVLEQDDPHFSIAIGILHDGRLLAPIGCITPAEAKEAFFARLKTLDTAASTLKQSPSGKVGAVH